jgi:integrase
MPVSGNVDLVPILREELSVHKAKTRFADMDDYVFPTGSGRRQDRNNARRRVFALSVERANQNLAEAGRNPLPEGLTPHSLRRTFISVLLALGEDAPYVMRQVGHSDPKVTLSIYAQVMFRGEGEAERLKALVEGSNGRITALVPLFRPPRVILKLLPRIKNPRLAGTSMMGTAGFEPATSRV